MQRERRKMWAQERREVSNATATVSGEKLQMRQKKIFRNLKNWKKEKLKAGPKIHLVPGWEDYGTMQQQDTLVQRLDFTNKEKSTGASINVSYKAGGNQTTLRLHSKPKDINIKDLRDLEKNVLFHETGPRERPGEPEGLSLWGHDSTGSTTVRKKKWDLRILYTVCPSIQRQTFWSKSNSSMSSLRLALDRM